MNKFYIERHENDCLYFIFKTDNSLFQENDVDLALDFFKENMKNRIKQSEFYGYSSYEDLDIKSSLIDNRFLSIRVLLKEEKKILKK